MMHLLRKYDVAHFIHNDVMFAKSSGEADIISEGNIISASGIICKVQTSFKKPDLSQTNRAFCWSRIRESIYIFLRKIVERMPSSRHPAAVHRTAAFEWVRLPPPPFPNKNTTRVGGVSVWSRIRESNPSTSVAALAFFVFVAEIVAEWILENWILGGRHLWRMPSLSVRQIGICYFNSDIFSSSFCTN